jgi:hypothetical protein
LQDQAGVLNDAYVSNQRDIVGARSQLTTVSIVLAIWGVIISVGLVILVSVAFTRMRRNRFLIDTMRPSQKSPALSDAEYGRPAGNLSIIDDDDDDDDDDDEEDTDNELHAVGSEVASVTAASDRQMPSTTLGRPLTSKAAGAAVSIPVTKAAATGPRGVILESDLDPDDLPVDVSGARLAGIFMRHLENYSEDELNAREAMRIAVGRLPTAVRTPKADANK